MLSSVYHRRFGPITRAALAGASLLALSFPLRADTSPPPAPAAPTATPTPAAPKPDASKPDAQRADADAMAAKRAADRAAFFDARIAAVHAGLQLTPDQDALWPPVNTAVHDLAGVMRAERDKRHDEAAPANAVEGLQRFSERAFARGTALKRLSDAVTPLYASLTADQKDRLPMLMRGLGPRMGREFGMRGGHERPGMDRDRRGEGEGEGGPFARGDDGRGRGRDFGMRGGHERPGMDRDRRGEGEGEGGGPFARGDDGRGGGRDFGRMDEARGDRFGDERADGGDRRDWGFQGRGPRQRDDRGGYGRGWDDAD